jgi:hypothetical protein
MLVESSLRTTGRAEAGVPRTLISALRRVASSSQTSMPGSAAEAEAQERCDFCGRPIPPEHRHFADLASRRFMCACEMCAVRQAEQGIFRPLPNRYLRLSGFKMPTTLWREFAIPVDMAFFVFNSALKRVVAFYPAPTGATESQLSLQVWEHLEQLNPALRDLAHDLEALLINRTQEQPEYYIVPIDACYRLVGLMRSSWQGIAGGQGAFDAIGSYFRELKERAVCQT